MTFQESGDEQPLAVQLALIEPLVPQIHFAQKPVFPLSFNLDAPPQEMEAVLVLTNKGTVPGEYSLRTSAAITFSIASGQLMPGASVSITVSIPITALTTLAANSQYHADIALWGGKFGELKPVDTLAFQIPIVDLFSQVRLNPAQISFEAIEGTLPDLSTAITVENIGTVAITGQLVANGDWLVVPDRAVELQFAPGASTTFNVAAGRALRGLPVGVQSRSDALQVQVHGKALRQPAQLAAQVRVVRASADIRLHSRTLWFGAMEYGQTRQPTDTLFMGNYGSAPWSGRLSLGVDWLSVPANTSDITLPAGQVLRLPVTVQNASRYLSSGAVYSPRALVLHGSDGQEIVVDARIIMRAASARVTVQPTQIVFNKRTINDSNRADMPITLTNSGTICWNVLDIHKPAWLQLSNEPSGIDPGIPETIIASVATDKLTETRHYNAALEIVGDGGQMLTISVSVEVVAFNITLQTTDPNNRARLRLRKGSANRLIATPSDTSRIVLKNEGQAPFTIVTGVSERQDVNFRIKPFLELAPEPNAEFILMPGEERVFQVKLLEDMSVTMKDVIVLIFPDKQKLSIDADFRSIE